MILRDDTVTSTPDDAARFERERAADDEHNPGCYCRLCGLDAGESA